MALACLPAFERLIPARICDVQIAIEQLTGPLDNNEMRLMRRLVDMIDACGASNVASPELVLSWLEEDLRMRLVGKVIDEKPDGRKTAPI